RAAAGGEEVEGDEGQQRARRTAPDGDGQTRHEQHHGQAAALGAACPFGGGGDARTHGFESTAVATTPRGDSISKRTAPDSSFSCDSVSGVPGSTGSRNFA